MPGDATLHLADYVDTEHDRIVATLFDWLRIPSISAHPDHAGDVRRSAEFIGDRLREAGFDHVALLETAGAPATYGDWLRAGPDAPTVLVYGHHDVQPVDPLELWTASPFDPTIVDGECRARGAVDDKGQTLYELEAARGLLRRDGRLPVNLKFIVEGEEEIGSPHFEELLVAHRDLLACDVIVVSDTGMWSADVPSICTGMRGLVAFDVDLRTGTIDLHSGTFGGAVPNPAHLAARVVSALHDAEGRVSIPGFYDDVRALTPEEDASIRALPFDEAEWMRTAGVRRLEGEAGRSTLERTWTRPTGEVVGITVGYSGAGIKTIVPAVANVKFTFRLVADQDPDVIATAFEAWLRDQAGPDVEVEIRPVGGVAPALTPVDHPAMSALRTAIERVWGTPPLFTREGGSGPEEALGRVLDAPVLYLGISLPDDRYHAPNERMVMTQFWKGLLAAGELLVELGATDGVGGARG
jgi:acetylornithine deacetylase/succinyl-diaminopimelate desuccinylase-like protein